MEPDLTARMIRNPKRNGRLLRLGVLAVLAGGLLASFAPAQPAAEPSAGGQPDTPEVRWPNRPTDKPIARPQSPKNVFVIPIHGEINDITTLLLERGLQEARSRKADMVVLRMDTPGGLVTSALDISNLIKRQRDLWLVAYVDPAAYSAGALISLACDEIIMRRNASLGDCAPIVMGGKLTGVEREKAESPLRQEFRDSAHLNGYDPLVAMSMVSVGIEVNELKNTKTGERRFADAEEAANLLGEGDGLISRLRSSDWEKVRTVVKDGELLTVTDKEAMELGLSKAIVLNDAEFREFYGIGREMVELDRSWSEGVAAFLASSMVRGLLVMVVFLGIYIEINTPGLGLPGLVALVAFIVLISGPFVAGLADWWEVALILLGIVLIALELFVIPGFGITGIAGIICFLAGLMFTFLPPNFGSDGWRPFPYVDQTWDYFTNALLWLLIGLVGFIVAAMTLSRFLRRIPLVNRVFLAGVGAERLDGRLTPTAPPNPPGGSGLENMVVTAPPPGSSSRKGLQLGQEGTVTAPCRPSGKVKFGRQTVDAVADGEYIDRGQSVRIVRFSGASVVVEPAGKD